MAHPFLDGPVSFGIASSSVDFARMGMLAQAPPRSSLLESTADPRLSKNQSPVTIRLEALDDSRYKFGRTFDQIVDKSPTLQQGFAALERKGYRLEAKPGHTFIDATQKVFGISSADLVNNRALTQSVSHELGHLLDNNNVADFRSQTHYVEARLKGEAQAVLTNLQVRQELLDAKVGDIGVLGSPAFEKQAVRDWNAYRMGAIDLGTLKVNLGRGYGDEIMSGSNGKTYVQSYQQQYQQRIEFNPTLKGKIVPEG